MAKVANAPAKQVDVNPLDELTSILGIEKSSRLFNQSTNNDKKFYRFINGEHKAPSIFKPENFKKYLEEVALNDGIIDKDRKYKLLSAVVNGKIDQEVESKVKQFDDIPLTESQKVQLQAATELYRSHLESLVAAAKSMIPNFK